MAKRSLKDRRCLITGASSGIGREIALKLASRHARLVLVARSADKLRHVADEIADQPGAHPDALRRVHIVVGDITSEEVRREALHTATTTYGGLDVLVNSAGIGAFGRFAENDPERLQRIMDVNFFAAVELTRLCLPSMQLGINPLIANIGSILGHRAVPHMSEYCASKFALRAWSESIRVELRPYGIDVLLVSPGTTETAFYDNVIEGRGQFPWTKSTAVPAARVAELTVLAIERGRREIVPNLAGKGLIWASGWFPSLVDRALRKYA